MISSLDIQKLQTKYKVKTKPQKDSHREFIEAVQKFREGIQSAFDGMKVLSRPGVTFTRAQKLMIYCLQQHPSILGKIKKWLIQRIILKAIDKWQV